MSRVSFKVFLIILACGISILPVQSEIIIVYPGQNLNVIINKATGGDTVLIKKGTYYKVILANKKFSEQKPLFIMSDYSGTATVTGDTVSKGSALEVYNCSYLVIERLTFTNARWGIYVKNSEHIILKNNEIFGSGQEGCHVGRSSRHVDILGNKIHNTGLLNSKWAEGIYVGSGSYGGNSFPDNCEYIWIEGNHIYETGNAEGINIKGECFHVTARNNRIHDIHPGTSEQYNQAAITVEGGENSLKNNYRLSEKRDVWIENNIINNVSDGYLDWNNGIMFFGTGVYILNNTINHCVNKGIYGNNWKDLGMLNVVYRNTISGCGESIILHPSLKVSESYPGENPHSPQKWNMKINSIKGKTNK